MTRRVNVKRRTYPMTKQQVFENAVVTYKNLPPVSPNRPALLKALSQGRIPNHLIGTEEHGQATMNENSWYRLKRLMV